MSTPSWDDVEVGDTVILRSVGKIEGIHLNGGKPRVSFETVPGWTGIGPNTTLESVEKPVRTFKPGDVVRDIGAPDLLYTVGEDRYFSHNRSQWFDDDAPFTTKQYELVEG
jgi:hypothetical protein